MKMSLVRLFSILYPKKKKKSVLNGWDKFTGKISPESLKPKKKKKKVTQVIFFIF